MLTALAYDI